MNLPERNNFYVSVNGVERYNENISLPQMFAVGDVKTGDTLDIRVSCAAGESSTMTVSAALLNYERFWAGYDILSASPLELTSFRTTRLEGTINCDRDGLLYTSIPQNGNWEVTVDGEAAAAKLVGDCMVALDLTKGEHQVVFRYHNAAFSLGWKISLACAVALLVLIQINYRPDWKSLLGKKKTKGKFQR